MTYIALILTGITLFAIARVAYGIEVVTGIHRIIPFAVISLVWIPIYRIVNKDVKKNK